MISKPFSAGLVFGVIFKADNYLQPEIKEEETVMR
jgi:hypothetical protein